MLKINLKIQRIKKLPLVVFLLFLLFNIFLFSSVSAQVNLSNWREPLEIGGGAGGAGYNTELISPEPIIETVIRAILSFLGVLFLILMVYGGILWMTARGNEEQVTKSKNLIIAAVIGLIIVLASYAISYFVIDAFTKDTLDF